MKGNSEYIISLFIVSKEESQFAKSIFSRKMFRNKVILREKVWFVLREKIVTNVKINIKFRKQSNVNFAKGLNLYENLENKFLE